MVFFSVLTFAAFSLALYVVCNPDFQSRQKVRKIFKKYYSYKTANQSLPEKAIWKGAAIDYFKAVKWNKDAAVCGGEAMAESAEDYMARQDVLRVEKEIVKELARRILLYEAAKSKGAGGVANTERVYNAVETASQGFFKN